MISAVTDATYTRTCQELAADVVYRMSFAEMDTWRRARARLVKNRCGYCWKAIHKQRSGTWYHDRTASASCAPGDGGSRRAFPAAERSN